MIEFRPMLMLLFEVKGPIRIDGLCKNEIGSRPMAHREFDAPTSRSLHHADVLNRFGLLRIETCPEHANRGHLRLAVSISVWQQTREVSTFPAAVKRPWDAGAMSSRWANAPISRRCLD
jgi:hypothetical protein